MISRKKRVDTMGIVEKELLVFVIKYIVRWLFSNDKNRKALEQLKKKGKSTT